MVTKKTFHNCSSFLSVLLILLLITGMSGCGSEKTLPSASHLKTAGGVEETDEGGTVNVFSFDVMFSDDRREMTAILRLSGEVSVCRYSLSIDYDDSALKLIDYDEELCSLSPIVFPGKDGDGKIAEEFQQGQIKLEWAHAVNITKAGEIIELKFIIIDEQNENKALKLNVNAVNQIVNDEVKDAEFSIKDVKV